MLAAMRRVWLAVLFAIAACHRPLNAEDIAWRKHALEELDEASLGLSEGARAGIEASMYDALFGRSAGDGRDLGNGDLVLRYRAAMIAAFYTAAPRHVDDMRVLFDELEARGLATSDTYDELYRAVVAARDFAKANAIARAHPSEARQIVPAVDGAAGDGPSELVLDVAQHRLARRAFAIAKSGVQVVVVGFPGCHFTVDAAQDIEADPALRAAMSAYSHWVAPQMGIFDWALFEQWNRAHPDAATTVADHQDVWQAAWPAMTRWSTPTFYVFVDGQLRTMVRGWWKTQQKAELTAALRDAGALR